MGKNKDSKLHYFLAKKNWGVRREYEIYANESTGKKKSKFQKFWTLVRLNFHYRICRSENPLLDCFKSEQIKTQSVRSEVASKSAAHMVNPPAAPVNYTAADGAYRLPSILTDTPVPKRFEVVVLAYRTKNANGGPGAVCTMLENTLGSYFDGIKISYYYMPPAIAYPPHLEKAVKDYPWIIKIQFQAAYFVQSKLSAWQNSTRDSDLFFVCHDIGTAYGVYLTGKKYVLVYHQQGSLINESICAGSELSEKECSILNQIEQVVMENAQTVYFPSNGAKDSYINTCQIDCSKINFGEPLYNTVLDKPVLPDLNLIATQFGLDREDRENVEVFLSVGDYNSNKGHDRIPALLNEYVRKTRKKVIWISAGDKTGSGIFEELEGSRKDWMFDSVLIGKRIPRDQILALMEVCDFYIMLHRNSIFDLATLEAMRAGLVPVLSKVGGNLEFNKENNAVLVDMDDFDGAVEAICDVDLAAAKPKNIEVFNKYFSVKLFTEAYKNMITAEMDNLGILPRFRSEINRLNLSQYKNMYDGETVVICGNGLSLHDYRPIPNAKHIALNKALFYKRVKFDMLFMTDEPTTDLNHSMDDYNKYDCEKFYGIITNPELNFLGFNESSFDSNDKRIHKFELAPRCYDHIWDELNFELDKYCLFDGQSVLFCAVQFAIFAGFKKIYLVGVDFSNTNYDGNENASVYALKVIDNLLSLKSKLRMYDDSIDINVISTGNRRILNALGYYDDVITVTGVCSDTYSKLLELQKKSCRDSFRFDFARYTDEEWLSLGTDSQDDEFWGYYSGLTERIEVTIDRIKKYWGGLLLLNDADVVFLKGTDEKIRYQLRDNDIMFIKERNNENTPYERAVKNINIGFVLMRCNEKSLKFWEEVMRRVKEKRGWDQEEVNLLLNENPNIIKWGFFSDEFLNGNDVTKANVRKQYICTGCGTIAKKYKLTKEQYLQRIINMSRGKEKKWFDDSQI